MISRRYDVLIIGLDAGKSPTNPQLIGRFNSMVKKILKIIAIVLFTAVIVIQFFRIDKVNPPVVRDETIDAAMAVPPDISLIIGRSCNDCHSNQTIYPWYSNLQPMGWFLKNHIDNARKKLNFSVWNTYSPQKRSKKFEEICEQLESREMPLPSYLWIHRDSILSDNDAKALCDWAKLENSKMGEAAQ